jgi:hypothetical protein
VHAISEVLDDDTVVVPLTVLMEYAVIPCDSPGCQLTEFDDMTIHRRMDAPNVSGKVACQYLTYGSERLVDEAAFRLIPDHNTS